MFVEVTLPKLSDSHDESLITFWHVSEGDAVEKGATLVEVQTEKAVSEIHAPESGTVKEIKKKRGDTAKVGEVLAVLAVEAFAPDSGGPQIEIKITPRVKKLAKELGVDWRAITPTGANGKITEDDIRRSVSTRRQEVSQKKIVAAPSVRKFAREQNVPLEEVTPSGKNGRILKSDIEAVLSVQQRKATDEAAASVEIVKKQESQEKVRRVPLTGIRKAITQAMVRSTRTIPQVTHFSEANATRLVQHRQRIKPLAEQQGMKLTYLVYVIKALAAVLKKYPMLNASLDEEQEEIVIHESIHIGFAVDTDRGLLVPVIRDADQKSLFQIAKEIEELSAKARTGAIQAAEMSGGTCTVSNIGSANGSWFTPIIHYPQSCILGIGKIDKKPIVINDSIEISFVMPLSLTYDHRLIDGVMAQHALNECQTYLSEPDWLFVM
ncbi:MULTISPECIES: dihydrolipoamide acetyltransferase family protein [Geobacillus]|jgi:pyruvate dehydrogenase E2 component (dihydrolipoamide acetyltransferase)|uniref:Dihydrolipoamide acetyltransferase component of pyruvate dehydrogenase complex n=1 Tax=Geobacillus thermodenitrificans (strain NG80-2) TaxID=420246 RepID=A4IKZ7_GEOTN|nr:MULTISPECIES: dihydrolipoamide acetyltransferase family protein [Geobacillus]ABO66001.1 Pyruvate dehydrogenase E2 (dihydrolipoamideacetyltransferase) [Geobacillus thermodenitrificans NG80-2]ARP41732.1 Dihydrolipoyllysine-residue acetyltransferase component of pyruvate dehydrogenase complex [Geobacillus thermodenitrificans]MED0664091.1 2-oxo acid dehydrogenase subunit E2 [Geobacillus thermodenitrificans]NNU86754.1 2-oxo acid dehydrogenase subunit E2 [Geobacillus sp. MR]OQP11413.1 dihydrolipo